MSTHLVIKESTALARRTKNYNRFQETYVLTKLYFATRFNAKNMSLEDIVEMKKVVQELRLANARKWAEHFFDNNVKKKLLRAAFKNQAHAYVKICRKTRKNVLRWQQLLQVCGEQGYSAIPYEQGHNLVVWQPTYFHIIVELPNGK